MNKTFYIVGGGRYGEAYAMQKYGFTPATSMEDADIVVFTGGADVHPSLYNEAVHPSAYPDQARDVREVAAFHRAKELGKVLFGICRGAQLLNVMAGGSLFQDIRHPGFHEVVTDDGERFYSNSVHHQMLRTADGAIIKAWAENLSPYHEFMLGGQIINIENVEKEPEVVLYPEHRMVLVQGHPEFDVEAEELTRFREFVFNLVKAA